MRVTPGEAMQSESVQRAEDCGALGARAKDSALPVALQDGEEVLKEGQAALARHAEPESASWGKLLRALSTSGGSVPGKLYLTPRRLIFSPNLHQDRTAALEIPLAEIETAHICTVVIRRGLGLMLRSGSRHHFLVRRPEEWMVVLAGAAGLTQGPTGNLTRG